MADANAPRSAGSSSSPSPRRADDGWGPSTAVRGGTARPDRRPVRPVPSPAPPQRADGDPWTPAGPPSRQAQRSNRLAERQVGDLHQRRTPERGLPWWGALLVLIGIAVIGGIFDTVGSSQVRGGFNIGIVVASVVAILAVKRSHMFPVVIAPPIVYSLAAVSQLYLRSGGLDDKRVVFDAAANYLVYGFPAIAAATAAVLIVAGFRMVTRK